MKNKLTHLNDHLFAQMERLSDEQLTVQEIERECARGYAIVAVSDQIIRNAAIQLQAARLVSEQGFDPKPHLPDTFKQIEGALTTSGRRQ